MKSTHGIESGRWPQEERLIAIDQMPIKDHFMIQSGHPVYLPTLDTPEPIQLDLLRSADAKLRQHDEAFLRDLIHQAPSVLPIGEIEPMFEFAQAICIELPNPAGFVDNLLVTPRAASCS